MYLTPVAIAAAGLLQLSSVAGHVISRQNDVRSTPLLLNIPGLPPTPHISNKGPKTLVAGLPLDNIQGDILIGMKKPNEVFFFFTITNVAAFKAALRNTIIPLITSTASLLGDVSKQPAAMVNIAFSYSGMVTLNVTDVDNLQDDLYKKGQFTDAADLHDDNPTQNWIKGFQGNTTHGVFLIASDQDSSITDVLNQITTSLGSAITETHRVSGAARPGNQQGHEHFGFLDGIANPLVRGVGTPVPGQSVLDPGIILTNELNDPVSTRPSWAKDGSFLVFRQLQQFVPEFNKFLLDNPTNGSSELTGARMIGRWKSGAPIDLSPLADNVTLGTDAQRNQNFTFDHPEIPSFDKNSNESRCPFSAHIRKTRPRADLNNGNTANQIIRAGIPYGLEVSADEARNNKSTIERGLAFVAYQSVIKNGFAFQQKNWADNVGFPPFKPANLQPGFDPIIGQVGAGAPRITSGISLSDPSANLTIPAFILSRGGEYFFSPSLSALADPIAK